MKSKSWRPGDRSPACVKIRFIWYRMKGGDGENGTESEADSSAYFRRNTNRLTKEEMKQRLESEKRWKAKRQG